MASLAAEAELPAPAVQIVRVPLQIYDVSAQGYRNSELYMRFPKSETGIWTDAMLDSQVSGIRCAGSSEWYRAREFLQSKHPEYEKDMIEGPSEWTGTILDFNTGELLEGITLRTDMPRDEMAENSREAVKNARIRLGKKDGILLPENSAYIKDLDSKYMPLIQQLWGVKDPKQELPDYTYLYVSPGFRPVVRGSWHWGPRANGRVNADAGYDAAAGCVAARLVSETRPDNALTPEQYEALMKELSGKPVLVE